MKPKEELVLYVLSRFTLLMTKASCCDTGPMFTTHIWLVTIKRPLAVILRNASRVCEL